MNAPSPSFDAVPRHDWTREELRALFALPFPELLFRAQSVHRMHFDPREVQISTLLSIKTGGCPEDCAYCPQADDRYATVLGLRVSGEDLGKVIGRQGRVARAMRTLMRTAAMLEGKQHIGLEIDENEPSPQTPQE